MYGIGVNSNSQYIYQGVSKLGTCIWMVLIFTQQKWE